MRYLTHVSKNYNYTADIYDFVNDATGETRVYGEPSGGTLSFSGGEGAGGNLKIYTDTFLRDFMRISNIKDLNGDLIYPDGKTIDPSALGATYEVRNSQPVLSVWGYSEGFRMVLVRV